ncbi:hypothetical protein [Streptomyces sp. NPDC048825]|uniref:hypothetical protein n=1 Tax=Streptomyces sp. NPDC048825 TaxID=3365592 RepID=UPI003717304C
MGAQPRRRRRWPAYVAVVFFKPCSGGGSLDACVVHTEVEMIELLQVRPRAPL